MGEKIIIKNEDGSYTISDKLAYEIIEIMDDFDLLHGFIKGEYPYSYEFYNLVGLDKDNNTI